MFTVCPKCALTLVVTAADLRVAQGYVRCGRCSSVFNALAQLSDDRQAAAAKEPAPEAAEEPGGTQAPPAAARETEAGSEEAASEDALEFDPKATDASSVFVAASPSPEWTAATGSFKTLVAANQEPVTPEGQPTAEAPPGQIDVELDAAALLSDVVHPEPAAPPARAARKSAAAALRTPASAPRERSASQPPAASPSQPRPAGHRRAPQDAATRPAPGADAAAVPQAPEGTAAALRMADLAAGSAARPSLKWTIGAALLALVLLVQLVDHRRDSLAADPRLGGVLTQLYSALGVRLVPRWDLRAYDVRQLGATVEPGSVAAITVRASIRNAGASPQPLPLLRVTLQDRFGNRLASREVPPRDYLPSSVAPAALLAADQRIDAELAFVDPGASAVGFELDACLPVRGGGVACANDASAR